MTDQTNEISAEQTNQGEPGDMDQQKDADNLREASYVVLFVAAVFIINAMETGSYRTPWPVAIITLLAGIGLFAYSWKQRPGK
jgi:protein-S-isoprenylcysteine O-methyltransferase Ste14